MPLCHRRGDYLRVTIVVRIKKPRSREQPAVYKISNMAIKSVRLGAAILGRGVIHLQDEPLFDLVTSLAHQGALCVSRVIIRQV